MPKDPNEVDNFFSSLRVRHRQPLSVLLHRVDFFTFPVSGLPVTNRRIDASVALMYHHLLGSSGCLHFNISQATHSGTWYHFVLPGFLFNL